MINSNNMKVKIKYHNKFCKILKLGDWIDLRAAEDVEINGPIVNKDKSITFHNALVSLGVSMKLPKYFEANIVPRSSTYGQYGVIQANHIGIIDHDYCGDNDIWKINLIALRDTVIRQSDRICQFRIRPAQIAPWWVKLKWLFSNKIVFEEVATLEGDDRGGFGSTNNK